MKYINNNLYKKKKIREKIKETLESGPINLERNYYIYYEKFYV